MYYHKNKRINEFLIEPSIVAEQKRRRIGKGRGDRRVETSGSCNADRRRVNRGDNGEGKRKQKRGA